MKRWKKISIVALITLSLLLTNTVSTVERKSTVGAKQENAAHTDAQNNSNAVDAATTSVKKSEQKSSSEKNSKDNIGDYDDEIDYQKLIRETKDENYRKSVDIKKDSFVVVSDIYKNTKDIKSESWYKEVKATGCEEIMKDNATDAKGKKITRVSYKITTKEKDIWSAVDYINQVGKVKIAEPVYKYYLSDESQPSSETNQGMDKQWYLKDQKLSSVWGDEKYGKTAGEGTVVAVIDTGVDYNHEDLQDNMWVNSSELSGQEGVDDDHNGYEDDIYGINLVDSAATPMDDHGHGTHVAGIIAMENNDKGGVGIAYKSKIMAIKAGGADGTLASSDIAKAVVYAYKNGADVINMSFGSYAHSAVVEQALQDAFGSSVLVAAAGNDAYPTLDAKETLMKGNMYPAAYSYVIGVMAYDENEEIADFSNWDYQMNYGAEYEIAAPGVSVYSTLPNSRYASWNGTSMAAPMVSAVAAILRSSLLDKKTYSSRYIMGQIVSATEDTIKFTSPLDKKKIYTYKKLSLTDSLTKKPKPNINVDEIYAFDDPDTDKSNNGDGIFQPGEVIDLAVGLRNQWGAAKDVYVTVDADSTGGVENQYIEFLTDKELKINDIGTFGTQNNGFKYNDAKSVVGVENPIRIKIKDNAPNDLNIQFHIGYHAKNALDETDDKEYTPLCKTDYTISIVKGTVLSGKISEDTTLSSDEYYIVKNSLLIPKGVTVDVEPGTKIQFWGADQSSAYGDDYIAYISVKGTMNFNGTQDAPIELFPGKDYESYRVQVEKDGNGTVDMNYVNIVNPYISISNGAHMNCTQDYDYVSYKRFDDNGNVVSDTTDRARISADYMTKSKISGLRHSYYMPEVSGKFNEVLFDNCGINYQEIEATNCTFLGNEGRTENYNSGTLEYKASKISNVGNSYRTPQYETVGTIHRFNGKKYVLYQLDNYVYTDDSDALKNYLAIEKLIEQNGGNIALLNPYDDDHKNLLGEFYKEKFGEDKTESLWIMSGYYFDMDKGECRSVNGQEVPDRIKSQFYGTSALGYLYVNMVKNGDSYETDTYLNSSNYLERFFAAEYPDTVSDSTIMNPKFNIEKLGIYENTKFTKNAILNRLLCKDTSHWMKVTAQQDNTYTYIAGENYWGTTDEKLIQKQIIDFDTNVRYADIITSPNLDAPSEDTYPCVKDIYITNKDGEKVETLSNGNYQVHVLFNRDMDQSIEPMVSYGPDDPYTDYTVSGSWKSSTEWVGTMPVKVLINQGKQYFRVKDAAAADDSWLTTGTDWGRYEFTIEASGAEALTLQAEGRKGGIYLNWTQDEYDTMAGYNVYRCDTKDGIYKKINSSIVAGNEKEYLDSKVASGKNYYYYFTVVDTDMKESRPSNIVSCASIDDIPPVIRHTEPKSFTNGMGATIMAYIKDNVGVNQAVLYYRMKGDEEYKEINMDNTSDASFSAQIAASEVKKGILQYYISAADNVSYSYDGSAEKPHEVEVVANAVITSVIANDSEVGKTVTGTVKGVNLTKECKIRIDGKIIDSEWVSENEMKFTFKPEYMGKKKVMLVENDAIVSSCNNAFTVSDSSVKVYNTDTILRKEQSKTQYVDLKTNYSGVIDSIEVTYGGSNWWLNACNMPTTGEKTMYGDGNIKTTTLRFNSEQFKGEQLVQINIYNLTTDEKPDIFSVKINGAEIETLDYDTDRISLVEEKDYVAVDKIAVEQSKIELEIGDSFKPEITVSPSNATYREFVKESFDPYWLHKNEDGTYTALQSGYCYLTLQCDNESVVVEVHIKEIPVKEIIPEKTKYTGSVGNTIHVKVQTKPAELTSQIQWTYGSGINLLNLQDYGRDIVVELTEVGTTYLEAYYNNENGERVSCNIPVEVLENTAYIEMNEDICTLYPNQTYSLKAQIQNELEGETQKIQWTSGNTSVATIDEKGVVSTIGRGCAVISASLAGSDKKATCIVLVGQDSSDYTLGDVNMDGKVTAVDAMLTLKLALLENPSDAILRIADVNNDGKITASDAMQILQFATGEITEYK